MEPESKVASLTRTSLDVVVRSGASSVWLRLYNSTARVRPGIEFVPGTLIASVSDWLVVPLKSPRTGGSGVDGTLGLFAHVKKHALSQPWTSPPMPPSPTNHDDHSDEPSALCARSLKS